MTNFVMQINHYKFDINPVPASRPRVTRWATFYSKKYTQFKSDMLQAVKLMEFNKIPKNIPVSCDIQLFIQLPTSYSEKKKHALNGGFCLNNADVDNYAKAILDGLNDYVFDDDRQVVDLRIVKRWALKGGFKVLIETRGQEMQITRPIVKK